MQELAGAGLVINRDRSSRLVHYPGNREEQQAAPKVILIGGYAGSGKSELGRILARQTGWAMLDKDTTTRPVVEAALEKLGQSPHDRESETYLSVIRPAEYQALMASVMENLECGNSVIATAPFIRELADQAWCDRAAASIESARGSVHVLWVRCDPDSMRFYLRKRGAARDASKLANWSEYLAGVNLEFAPKLPHQIIDNSVGQPPLQQQAAEALSRVKA